MNYTSSLIYKECGLDYIDMVSIQEATDSELAILIEEVHILNHAHQRIKNEIEIRELQKEVPKNEFLIEMVVGQIKRETKIWGERYWIVSFSEEDGNKVISDEVIELCDPENEILMTDPIKQIEYLLGTRDKQFDYLSDKSKKH